MDLNTDLVLQIAAGIVLGGLVLFCLFIFFDLLVGSVLVALVCVVIAYAFMEFFEHFPISTFLPANPELEEPGLFILSVLVAVLSAATIVVLIIAEIYEKSDKFRSMASWYKELNFYPKILATTLMGILVCWTAWHFVKFYLSVVYPPV